MRVFIAVATAAAVFSSTAISSPPVAATANDFRATGTLWVRLAQIDKGFKATFHGGTEVCSAGHTRGRVSISSGRWKMVAFTADICSEEAWSHRGRVPAGFLPSTYDAAGGSVVKFRPNGNNLTRKFRVDARTRHSRDAGWLSVNWQRFWHWEQIYEGTDAFVNFCINRSKEIRSDNGRLFCWRESPVTGPTIVRFHR